MLHSLRHLCCMDQGLHMYTRLTVPVLPLELLWRIRAKLFSAWLAMCLAAKAGDFQVHWTKAGHQSVSRKHLVNGRKGVTHSAKAKNWKTAPPDIAGGPTEIEQLMEQIGTADWSYSWLSTAAVQALVCWLAATIHRPNGKFTRAMAYFTQAQQVIDEELRRQGMGQVPPPPTAPTPSSHPKSKAQTAAGHAVWGLCCVRYPSS